MPAGLKKLKGFSQTGKLVDIVGRTGNIQYIGRLSSTAYGQ